MGTQGWECPKCGRVYAPWVFQCKFCGPTTSTPLPWPWDPALPRGRY